MEKPEMTEAVIRLEPELAFLTRALDAIYRRRGYPLERAHYLLLHHLRGTPKSSRDLAEELSLDHSTIARQIGAMLRQGLVSKTGNPADERSRLIEPTVRGRHLYESTRDIRLERIASLLDGWEESDRRLLADLTVRFNHALRETLDEFEPGTPISLENSIKRK